MERTSFSQASLWPGSRSLDPKAEREALGSDQYTTPELALSSRELLFWMKHKAEECLLGSFVVWSPNTCLPH